MKLESRFERESVGRVTDQIKPVRQHTQRFDNHDFISIVNTFDKQEKPLTQTRLMKVKV